MHRQEESSEKMVANGFSDRGNAQEHTLTIDYDQIPVPCCAVDVSAFIQGCNEPLANLLGCPKDSLVRTSLLDVVDRSSYPVIEKIMTSPVTDGVSSSFSIIGPETIWLRRKDDNNTIFPATLRVKPVKDNHGRITGYIMAINDETLNRRKVELLEKDRDQLKEKEQLQDEFIAVASHELRTPIQPILGFAFLAKKGLLSQEKAWDGVLEEARRLQHLANDILDVSRIESGTLGYEMKSEQINRLLVSVTKSVRSEVQKEDVSLVLVYDEAEADLEIQADRARITQVISNILGNAVKFTDKGTIRVESKAFPDQNKFEIRVSDTGKGIAEEILPKLFDKFVTKGHGNIQNNKGTGLGLYISKGIVKAHGGEISAFNNSEGGATFVIVLPISQDVRKEPSKKPDTNLAR